MAVYLSLASFACMLAAALLQKMDQQERDEEAGKILRVTFRHHCNRWPYLMVASSGTVTVVGFAMSILYEVYLSGHAADRRCAYGFPTNLSTSRRLDNPQVAHDVVTVMIRGIEQSEFVENS